MSKVNPITNIRMETNENGRFWVMFYRGRNRNLYHRATLRSAMRLMGVSLALTNVGRGAIRLHDGIFFWRPTNPFLQRIKE